MPNAEPGAGTVAVRVSRQKGNRAPRLKVDRRKLANPSDRRSRPTVTLLTEAEAEQVRMVAAQQQFTVSDWLRAAIRLLVRTGTDLRAADTLPSTPLSAEGLAAEGYPVIREPNPTHAPWHCGQQMQGDPLLECARCGLQLLRAPE